MALKNLAKKKEPAANKAKGIVLDLPDEVKERVDEWTENNRAMKDAKANMEQAEQDILEYAEPAWREACKRNGSVETSAKLGNIRISWKGKSQFVTTTSVGDGSRAKEVFGEEDYKRYFKEIDQFEITEAAANHPEVSKKLEEALEKIQKEHPDVDIVSVKTKVIATEDIHRDWVLGNNDEIEAKFSAAGIKKTKCTFAQR